MITGLVLTVLLASPAAYLLHHFVVAYLCGPRDLKQTYSAQWALVTGASSGIGKALAKKLASQGLNVVLVALPDQLLQDTYAELTRSHPAVKFRAVGANLGKHGYLPQIAEATADISVQIVVCNAGYMITGFFETKSLEEQLANLECNATSAVSITHHFLTIMLARKLRGCVVLTSSAAAAIVSPMTVMYAATKSFLSSFGASLAVEVKHAGVDVLVFHPSPVNTRFYDKAHALDILQFFKGQAVPADALPDAVFASIGRTVWRDVGPTAVLLRLLMKLVDYNFMASLTAVAAPVLPDFRMMKAGSKGKAA